MAPWRKAAGMPRNTIQISDRRIRISLHSAGCSRMKRVTIWNMPSTLATTSMAQAPAMARPLVKRSMRRKVSFTGGSLSSWKGPLVRAFWIPACAGMTRGAGMTREGAPARRRTLLEIADAFQVRLAELLLELGVHRCQRLHELG